MQTKELVKPKEEKAVDTPKIRYFKTVFSHGISWDMNTMGRFVDRSFVESVIYKRNPDTTWIGETVEVQESDVPFDIKRLN